MSLNGFTASGVRQSMSETVWGQLCDLVEGPEGVIPFWMGKQTPGLRRKYVSMLTWSTPTSQTLVAVADYLKDKYGPVVRVLSVGCGQALPETFLHVVTGLDVVLTDLISTWEMVEALSASDAVQKYGGNIRVLYLSWPEFGAAWAQECVVIGQFEVVIYVGEGMGGCTADDAFHQHMEACYTLMRTLPCKNWAGIRERVFVYERRGQPGTRLRQADESDGDIEKSVNEQKSVNKGWPVPAEVEHLESDMFHVATYPNSYDSPGTYVMENTGRASA